jgi:hypothetical protein
MKLRTFARVLLVGFVACIVLLIVLLGFLFWRMNLGSTRPTDASLIHQFKTSQVVFEEVKQMLKTDEQIGGVAGDYVFRTNSLVANSCAEAGISVERQKRYSDLLKQAGVRSVEREGNEIHFPVARWGAFSHGWRIAVIWTDVKPKPLIANLDDFKKTTNKWEQAYRPLGDGWYLWIIW